MCSHGRVVRIDRTVNSAAAAASAAPGFSQTIWRDYSKAIVEIEVGPGRWANLNGPDALDELPLPAPIHVITAYNPHGRERPEDANRAAAARLAGELWVSGVTMSRTLGRSPSGDHREAGVAVSGLSRAEALRLGRRYGQLAIYEVTADSIILVACEADHAAAFERRATAICRDPLGKASCPSTLIPPAGGVIQYPSSPPLHGPDSR